MSIPTRHRDALLQQEQGRLTLTRHPDGCLLVYPRSVWEEKREQIARFPMSARFLQRLLLGSAQDVDLDSAGRILIAPELRAAVGLERDAMLLLLYLKRGGYEVTSERVDRETDMKKQLAIGRWDVIISDFNLPGFNAFAALKTLDESGRKIPVIVVSGEISEEVIAGVKKAGAAEYLAKYEMRQIVPAIERVLQVHT